MPGNSIFVRFNCKKSPQEDHDDGTPGDFYRRCKDEWNRKETETQRRQDAKNAQRGLTVREYKEDQDT